MKELEWSDICSAIDRGIQQAYRDGYIVGARDATEKMKEEVSKIKFVAQYNGYNNMPTITESK